MSLRTPSGRPIGGHEPGPQEPDDPEVAAADRAVADAQRDLEDAAAQGGTKAVDAAHRALGAARSAAERVRAAQRGRSRRAEAKAEAEAERKRTAERVAFYRWSAEWVRRAAPVLALREELEQAEKHLAELGPRPNPLGGRGDVGAHLNVQLWGDLPEAERACARAIPYNPEVVHDPTIEKIKRGPGASPGNPIIRGRLSGPDRFERLAEAIDRLAGDSQHPRRSRRGRPGSAGRASE